MVPSRADEDEGWAQPPTIGDDTRTGAPPDGRLAAVPGFDPVLKRFIDDVVIPALLDRLSGTPRGQRVHRRLDPLFRNPRHPA